MGEATSDGLIPRAATRRREAKRGRHRAEPAHGRRGRKRERADGDERVGGGGGAGKECGSKEKYEQSGSRVTKRMVARLRRRRRIPSAVSHQRSSLCNSTQRHPRSSGNMACIFERHTMLMTIHGEEAGARKTLAAIAIGDR